MADPSKRPIIIKRKVSHEGHHGGAWKVAYADFVTAMMALFIVLWLLNSSKKIQEAVGGYFKDPSGAAKLVGNGTTGKGDPLNPTPREAMAQLKEALEKAVHNVPELERLKGQIEMTITPEGLRIEMMETAQGAFFPSGLATPTDDGKELLTTFAKELGKLPNKISVEGHTDSTPFARDSEYGNWELSSDRAHAARRLMQRAGLAADQVTQVRGFADQRLRRSEAPNDPSNRRVSLIVQYLPGHEPAPVAAGGETKPPQSHAETVSH